MQIADMFKIGIGKRKALIYCAAFAGLALILYFVYLPLLKDIKKKSVELNSLKGTLEGAWLNSLPLRKNGVSKKLISWQEASSAMDAIAKEGRNLSLDFKSISQKEARDADSHTILPIRMEIEGDYANLGYFFGALENMRDMIVTVEELQIRPSDRAAPKISVAVTLLIHLSKN